MQLVSDWLEQLGIEPSRLARPMERVRGPQMGDFVRALQMSVVWFSKIP